jgi:signal transduction histidine kinase
VSKYANASRVTIRLWSEHDEDDELLFSVTDDGRGFDTASVAFGAGVQNMSDRLAALGGRLDLASEPGRGTTVTGRVPARLVEPSVRSAP